MSKFFVYIFMKIIQLFLFFTSLNRSQLFNQKKSLMARDIGKFVYSFPFKSNKILQMFSGVYHNWNIIILLYCFYFGVHADLK